MKILVIGDFDQKECIKFRQGGHEAYSCGLQECSGGHEEWHIFAKPSLLINGCVTFQTQNGDVHEVLCKWDEIIKIKGDKKDV